MAKFCTNCGAEINEEQDICLSCGKKINKNKNTNENGNNQNKMALTGFIIAMVSLILNFGGLVGLTATILSAIGLSQISKTGESGKGLAIAGLIVGIASIVYGLYSITNLIDIINELRIIL